MTSFLQNLSKAESLVISSSSPFKLRGKAHFRQGLGEAGTQRADDGAGLGIGTGQALADRRLAIGAGDGDQRQRFARVAVDGVRQCEGVL